MQSAQPCHTFIKRGAICTRWSVFPKYWTYLGDVPQCHTFLSRHNIIKIRNTSGAVRQLDPTRNKMAQKFQVFRVVQSAQLWQSFPNDCQTFIKRRGILPNTRNWQNMLRNVTTCHIINQHDTTLSNVIQLLHRIHIRAILNRFKIWVRFCQMNHFYKIDSAREPIFSKSLQVVPTCKPCQTDSHLRQFTRHSQTFIQVCATCARDEKWISLCQLIHFGTPY